MPPWYWVASSAWQIEQLTGAEIVSQARSSEVVASAWHWAQAVLLWVDAE